MASWLGKPVKGFLLDITGVLYESGENLGTVISGSVEAVKKLRSFNIPFRLLTNESASTNEALIQKLSHHGYNFTDAEIFSPIPAMKIILKAQNLRPFLIVHSNVKNYFDDFDQSNPNCVVMGDAENDFNFRNMNSALNVLLKQPRLFTLGKGKYYLHEEKLQLDAGAFGAALEFATGVKGETVGKPCKDYFNAALKDMKISADEVIMVGDDIDSDVGGAQAAGMRAILVKTGKFIPDNLNHKSVKPDYVAQNLLDAINTSLNS